MLSKNIEVAAVLDLEVVNVAKVRDLERRNSVVTCEEDQRIQSGDSMEAR